MLDEPQASLDRAFAPPAAPLAERPSSGRLRGLLIATAGPIGAILVFAFVAAALKIERSPHVVVASLLAALVAGGYGMHRLLWGARPQRLSRLGRLGVTIIAGPLWVGALAGLVALVSSALSVLLRDY